MQTAIAFLCTRVNSPTVDDYHKLRRCIKYLRSTRDLVLRMQADNLNVIKWYVGGAFAVHKDMKSHTGAIFTLGKGAIISDSMKQKVNTRSSTEAEMVAIDDKISKVIKTTRFIEHQGFEVKLNII